MRSFLWSLCACVILSLNACGGQEPVAPVKAEPPPPAKAPPKPDAKTVRLFIMPFQNGMRAKDTDYFSLGLAAFLTERLEEASHDAKLGEALAAEGLRLEVFTGPLILTQEQTALRDDTHADLDLEAAGAAAAKQNATLALTGSYAGDVGKFRMSVSLYRVGGDKKLALRSEKSIGPVSIYKTRPAPRPGVQIADVQAMAAELAAQALREAGVPLTKDAEARLRAPQTPDAMSFINYARALDRYFWPEDASKHRTDLEFAADAVRIWPDYCAARRMYGFLLWQAGQVDKARVHLREIIEPTQPADPSLPRRVGLPDDLRALVMLGRVELESKQYQAAIGYLERAAAHTPDDAQVHFWLGEAHAQLGDTAEAVTRYELSRKLDPSNIETHRALSALYAVSKRYDDAAEELAFVAAKEPQDIDVLFLLAACHRAGGRRDAALKDYDLGLRRFPDDVRLHKFRGDTLSSLGRSAEAQEAYARTRALAPKDARFSQEAVLFGDALVAQIAADEALHDGMEGARATSSLAASIATWDLAWHGTDACQDGRAGSDFLLAQSAGRGYGKDGKVLFDDASKIGRALKNGEGFALTPDEQGRADKMIRYAQTSLTDLRELQTGYEIAKGLVARSGCDLAKSVQASIADVRERDRHLQVTLKEPPPRDASGISPVVPTGEIGNVTFKIRNETDRAAVIVFWPDGKPLEPAVPAKKEWSYTTSLGYHGFCVLPKASAADCGKPGTVRNDYIHEGWVVTVR